MSEMATESDTNTNKERRKRVFVGKLPPDFLKITNNGCQSSQQQQEAADAQTALALQHQLDLPYSYKTVGMLSVTVAQAKLVKNYGLIRMDPYVSLRVGHSIYETHPDTSGGKNPKWDKVFHCGLLEGINTIHIKIYDECSIKVDELIAWADIAIPPNVMKGETCEDWFPLSGKQGVRVEGMINLVISFTPGTCSSLRSVLMDVPSTYGHGTRPIPVSVSPTPYPVNPVRTFHFSAEDLKQVEEMFPNMDKDVVKSVFEANGGNKDLTVNSLLQMST